MTNDLISREALLKNECCGRISGDDVRNAPAIDAAPVVHAEWDHWGGDEWQCTNCAEFIHTEGSWDRPYQKYCPYCGAKMDAGDDTNAQPD